jgi:hypothetical protein
MPPHHQIDPGDGEDGAASDGRRIQGEVVAALPGVVVVAEEEEDFNISLQR